MSLDPMISDTPRMLGRYELLVPVARGGMGQVWLGRLRGARGFNKLVAVKTLLPLADTEGRLEGMLLEEARLAALIHHANVVQTLELGEQDRTLYLVMEWIDGESLAFTLHEAEQRGGLPLPVAVNWVGQTLLGLHAAHELTDELGVSLGVVHRDVSPHNVLITHQGVAKLVDFGIAKATNQSLTESGEVKGKISYMAPEQIRCEAVDRRTDIFSAGIMLYLLTTRRHPFQSGNSANMLRRLMSDEPAPPPSALVSGYPSPLEQVVLKAIDKNPERRWASAEQMFEALQHAVPEAFETGSDARLREYLQGLLGERFSKRREALRRAQLAADSRAPVVDSSSPAQSASSLRAISVDRSAEELEPRAHDGSGPKPSKKRSRVWLLTALAVIAGVAGPLFVTHLRSTHQRATAANTADMVELTQASALAPTPTFMSNPASPPRLLEDRVPVTEPTAVSVEAPAALPSATPPKPRRERQLRRSPARNAELLVPDYAR